MGFPDGSEVKTSACNAGDLGSIHGLGRSPREGNGTPLQCSCLENPMDGGAWWATVHGVAKSRTRLSDFTFTFTFPIWNQPIVPCLVLTVASCRAYRFLRRQVRWSCIPISLRIFQFVVIHTKALVQSMKQKLMFLWNSLAFSMIQQMLAIRSLVSLPFLHPDCTFGSSHSAKSSLKDFECYLASM